MLYDVCTQNTDKCRKCEACTKTHVHTLPSSLFLCDVCRGIPSDCDTPAGCFFFAILASLLFHRPPPLRLSPQPRLLYSKQFYRQTENKAMSAFKHHYESQHPHLFFILFLLPLGTHSPFALNLL